MTKKEFLDELKERLSRLPQEELDSALEYYNEIFLDAGEENEETTAEKLGSIENIARQIYIENGIEPDGRPLFMLEEVVEPKRKEEARFDEPETGDPAASGQPIFRESVAQRVMARGGPSAGAIIAMVLLFPLWFPLLITLMVLCFVFFIVCWAIEISLVAAGVGLVISGVVTVFKIPPIGLMGIGAGLVLCGIFGLTFKAAFRGPWKGLTAFIRGIANVGHNIFFGGEPA
ncbi:MAG: DUF1700 domain-containing protein [Ruminococcus sp.]|nr:DUF1700 domain-containing protein [Ruminococcus sp.]